MERLNTYFYEDLQVGLEFRTALSEPIKQEVIDSYFTLTQDRFGIHSDPHFAGQFYNDIIVPGNLVVARATGLVYERGYLSESLVVQAAKNIRFVSPLYIGGRIYVIDRVTTLEDRPEKRYGKVILERRTLNQNDDLILLIEQDYRVLKRPNRDIHLS